MNFISLNLIKICPWNHFFIKLASNE